MNTEPTTFLAGWAPADLGFVRRTLRTSTWLGAVAVVLAWVWQGTTWAVGFAGGAFIGIANLVLLAALFREVLTRERRNTGRIIALLAIKVPLVYGGLAALLLSRALPAISMVAGFSLVLAVILLKALGRALVGERPRQRAAA